MVSIIDYGMGNLRSVQNALHYLGFTSRLVHDPSELLQSERLILPGVGSFMEAMKNLNRLGLVEPIRAAAARAVPLLGVCLGMQLLAERGDEGGVCEGLGLIPGTVTRLDDQHGLLKVPHMGFNQVLFRRPHVLFTRIEDGSDFYFAHSYQLIGGDEDALAATVHGTPFTSVVARNKVLGVQFHPEKSQSHGLELLRNFCGLPAC